MRILLVSDSPFSISAYAQTALPLAHYLKSRHEIIYYGLSYQGIAMDFDGIRLVGNLGNNWNQILLQHYIDEYHPDIVLTIKDPIVFGTDMMKKLSVPWVAFSPVDTEPPSVALQNILNQAYRILTPTLWSQAALKALNIQSDYTPHWVDTKFFAVEGKGDFRKANHIPDNHFLVTVVGDNNEHPSRKNLDKIILTWVDFCLKHTDAVLYLHTDLSGNRGGHDLANLLNFHDVPKRSYRFTDQALYNAGMNVSYLRDLYQASNVLLAPSGGEGFCIPVIESQSCGIPVIATDWTALKETVKTGYIIDTEDAKNGDIWYVNPGGYRYRTSRYAIKEGLEQTYTMWKTGSLPSKYDVRERIMHYDIESVLPVWFKILEDIEKEISNA